MDDWPQLQRRKRQKTIYEELKQRQSGQQSCSPRAAFASTRRIYASLTPNHTIYNVEIPFSSSVNRFTPDGKYLICFTPSQGGMQLYQLIRCVYPEDNMDNSSQQEDEDPDAFRRLFSLRYDRTLKLPEGHLLCKDFCLVIPDTNYMILASSKISLSEPSQTRQNPCSLDGPSILSDYVFYVVAIETGEVTDQYAFRDDYICLPQHSGVSLYHHIYAVMSIRHQTVHLFSIDHYGKLHLSQSIGWHLNYDDQLFLEQHWRTEATWIQRKRHRTNEGMRCIGGQDPGDMRGSDDIDSSCFYGAIQQIVLSKLYRMAISENDGGHTLVQFYRNFNVYASLKLWRIQLLSESKLLIKMIPESAILNQLTDISSQFAIFIVLNLHTRQIEKLFDNSSEEVVKLFTECADIRQCHSEQDTQKTAIYMELRKAWKVHKWMGLQLSANRSITFPPSNSEALKRLAADLPRAPQSSIDSPYFDLSLFSYDDKLLNWVDRPRTTSDIIKFYSRKTGELAFKIDPNPAPASSYRRNDSSLSRRCALSLISHPVYPFIITKLQTAMRPPVVNFHVYKSHTM
ncbi:acid phosphatase det1 [Apophysomyces ossiformis]|uniref:Acid phosphatase det1 n=1 Tax=Apophysomyces ossiformis TaxID=679940 RepID=A0A8H7ETK9_9FUNG|nr:acid phosphatase det1 [Apophysomyces ossiformis]